mgnify:FL=1
MLLHLVVAPLLAENYPDATLPYMQHSFNFTEEIMADRFAALARFLVFWGEDARKCAVSALFYRVPKRCN